MTSEDYPRLGLLRSGVSILFTIGNSWELIRRGPCSKVSYMDGLELINAFRNNQLMVINMEIL